MVEITKIVRAVTPPTADSRLKMADIVVSVYFTVVTDGPTLKLT